jgi:Sec7-like guanine-nucleotide exchange factor
MLAYATVMLDLDIHSKNTESIDLKDLINEFQMNLKGINDGEDFSNEFVNSIIENVLNQ